MDNTRWLKSMGDTRKVTYPYKRGVLEVHLSKDYTLTPEDIKEIYQAAKGGGKRARTHLLPQGQRVVFSILRPPRNTAWEQTSLLGGNTYGPET